MAKKKVASSKAAKAAPKAAKKAAAPVVASAAGLLAPPDTGVKIRMYRQGHGDCFLLTFRQDDGSPFYMLIDCGMKKGSAMDCTIQEVAENIRDVTGGHLHLVVITHEHEDHVSGFLSEKAIFETLTIDKLWLAWTEDPDNELANQLRQKYKDVLFGLVTAETRLRGLGARDRADERSQQIVDALLGFELSDADRQVAAAQPAKIKGRTNKEGIQIVKREADKRDGTAYLRPHGKPLTVPGVSGVRFFVLGPPENEKSLKDMDPQGDEEFHFAMAEERSFLAACGQSTDEGEAHQPFSSRYRISAEKAQKQRNSFFTDHYFAPKSSDLHDQEWRRIDGDWLRSSEQFALRMGNYINNTSVVLAVELPGSKKVLLLVGDAQRGNWVSWKDKNWPVGGGTGEGNKLTARDLLNRTVFYKVGHHGSHNATMNAGGLQEMAQGDFADEFVAMIPANQKWAETANTPPWLHPLKAIHTAILKKAKGRVFVADRELKKPSPSVLSTTEWKDFTNRTESSKLYFEFTVTD